MVHFTENENDHINEGINRPRRRHRGRCTKCSVFR